MRAHGAGERLDVLPNDLWVLVLGWPQRAELGVTSTYFTRKRLGYDECINVKGEFQGMPLFKGIVFS